MRIYGTGDLHLGQSIHYGKTDENGYPDKLKEQKEMLATFTTDAITNNADMVVFAGDYFPKHFRINPDAMRVFSEQIVRLVKADIPVKILEGNHDKARIEVLDSTVQMLSVFDLPNVEIINKPCVQHFDEVDVLFVPHLIPAELTRYQKDESDDVPSAMSNLIDELVKEIDKKKPVILFGHFGIAEAGRGSESTMIAGNNICISSLVLDRPEIQHCFLGHIHKSWQWKGKHTNITYFGSMDRFDFAEANDNKEYGVITVANNQVIYETVDTAARPFVDIKHYIGIDDDEEDVGFLSRYSLNNAVVKVNVEVDKDFKGGDKVLDRIKKELVRQNVYHIHGMGIVYKPTFVAKNAQVTEAGSVEDNLQRVLLDEGFSGVDELLAAHTSLMKEIQAEDEAEAEK